MSKYIKLDDAIKSVADQYMFEANVNNPQSCDDIKEWEKVASRLFSDLPTIDIVKYSHVYILDSNEEPQRWCKVGLAKAVDDDDYCSWGEMEGDKE